MHSVNYQQQSTTNSSKNWAHAANVLTIGTGLGATGACLTRGIRLADNVCSDAIALTNSCKPIGTKTGVVFEFFEKLGKKIFRPNSKLGQIVERFVTGKLPSGGRMSQPKQIAAVVKKFKTIGAMGVVAAIALSSLLAKGIYNAGKINGQK